MKYVFYAIGFIGLADLFLWLNIKNAIWVDYFIFPAVMASAIFAGVFVCGKVNSVLNRCNVKY